jgi:hypothetical protein
VCAVDDDINLQPTESQSGKGIGIGCDLCISVNVIY